jgi:V/A-type H+-transporting ATPase subunit E
MDNRLQELTEKIYREGLEKGNQEAEKIVSAAKAQAEEIIKRARVEENRILEEAKKASAEMRENTMAELKLSMRRQ